MIETIHLVLRTLPGSFSSLQKLDAELDDCTISRLTSLQVRATTVSATMEFPHSCQGADVRYHVYPPPHQVVVGLLLLFLFAGNRRASPRVVGAATPAGPATAARGCAGVI